jgi:hypothetical protein
MRFGRVRHAPLTPTSSKRQIRRYQNKVNESLSLTADLQLLARRGLRTVSPRTTRHGPAAARGSSHGRC